MECIRSSRKGRELRKGGCTISIGSGGKGRGTPKDLVEGKNDSDRGERQEIGGQRSSYPTAYHKRSVRGFERNK